MNYLILFLFSFLAFGRDCSRYQNDCEYYSCVSQERNCLPHEYPERFGRRFCLRYNSYQQMFTKEGKRWIHAVRGCLIQKMSEFPGEISCSGLKHLAFKSHIPCYLENGFCNLSTRDKRAVIEVIWPTIRNVYVLADGLNIIRACR